MRSLFCAIVKAVRANQPGGTFSANGNKLTYLDGYQVGLLGTELRFSKDLPPEDLYELAMWVAEQDMSAHTDSEFGLWASSDTEYCVDVSIHVSDRDRALRLGKGHQQEAVYDWATGKALYC